VQTLAELIDELPALRSLSPANRALLAGCARNQVFSPGAEIMREGDAADAFYIVRAGTVSIVTQVPGRGEITIETLHAGDLLGWSWLVEPYRNAFGARATGDVTRVLALDGVCLRGKCEADPALGYELLKLLASVFAQRLRDTRVRLLDLYGSDA
jgi:CRP/FNR family cyclic AMP-dependent transcriptional regulator